MKTDDRELRSLMRDIENSTINKTDWLKRSEILALQERHRQRNINNLTLADALVTKGFIDLRHRDYGFDYLELRMAVYGPLAYSKNPMLKLGDTSLKRNNASRVYEMVSKAIGRQAEHFIDSALNSQVDNSIDHEFVANVFRLAFETLETEIDRVLKLVAEEEKVLANDN